jgi:hypothetical protein
MPGDSRKEERTMKAKLTKIVLSVALMSLLSIAVGCDKEGWGGYGDYTSVLVGFDFWPSVTTIDQYSTYSSYEEVYTQDTVSTGYYDGGYVDGGGYVDNGGSYDNSGYWSDWKAKRGG